MNKVTEKKYITMPSFICMLVNSSQNSFWDIILCDLQGGVIQAVRYYYYSLLEDMEMDAQANQQTCPRLHS